MALNATLIKTTGKARVQQDEIEIDNYPSRVAQVIDLGIHPREKWDTATNSYVVDNEKKPAQKMFVTYELTDEFCKDEKGEDDITKPRWLSERLFLFNLDVDLATSTKRYKAIDPTMAVGGDWTKLTGAPCMVMVAHKKSGKAKVGAVTPAGKRTVVGPLVNESKVFLMDAPDMEIFNSLPEWLQNEIKAALNYKGSALQVELEVAGEPAPQEAPQEAPEEFPEAPEAPKVDGEDIPW